MFKKTAQAHGLVSDPRFLFRLVAWPGCLVWADCSGAIFLGRIFPLLGSPAGGVQEREHPLLEIVNAWAAP